MVEILVGVGVGVGALIYVGVMVYIIAGPRRLSEQALRNQLKQQQEAAHTYFEHLLTLENVVTAIDIDKQQQQFLLQMVSEQASFTPLTEAQSSTLTQIIAKFGLSKLSNSIFLKKMAGQRLTHDEDQILRNDIAPRSSQFRFILSALLKESFTDEQLLTTLDFLLTQEPQPTKTSRIINPSLPVFDPNALINCYPEIPRGAVGIFVKIIASTTPLNHKQALLQKILSLPVPLSHQAYFLEQVANYLVNPEQEKLAWSSLNISEQTQIRELLVKKYNELIGGEDSVILNYNYQLETLLISNTQKQPNDILIELLKGGQYFTVIEFMKMHFQEKFSSTREIRQLVANYISAIEDHAKLHKKDKKALRNCAKKLAKSAILRWVADAITINQTMEVSAEPMANSACHIILPRLKVSPAHMLPEWFNEHDRQFLNEHREWGRWANWFSDTQSKKCYDNLYLLQQQVDKMPIDFRSNPNFLNGKKTELNDQLQHQQQSTDVECLKTQARLSKPLRGSCR